MSSPLDPRRDAPRVTVLMAVFNGERHLRAAIDSILEQSFSDFELLIVDDASTDSSMSIVADYDDTRIVVVGNEQNLGLTKSLNRGLAVARGEYVARLDADDLAHPDRLALQVAHLDRHPTHALVASAYQRIGDDGTRYPSRAAPLTAEGIRWRLLFLNAFAHSSVTFRRGVTTALGGYDEAFVYAQDYELWSRLADRHPVAALPQELAAYRDSAVSMTNEREAPGGVDETATISRANMERVAPGTGRRIDREAAWRILFGRAKDVPAGRALRVAPDVLRLHRSFSRYYGLPREASTAQGLRTGTALAKGLRASIEATVRSSNRPTRLEHW